MNQTAQFDTKYARTLEDLRRIICMATPGEDLTLHETALTARYGMSRTPIRQILQRLAYERLVETKSGVGTVVTPLREDQHQRDLLVHCGLLEAVLSLDVPELTIAQHSDVLALAGIASMVKDGDRDLQYDLRHKLYSVLSSVIPDPILLDAFSASYWRIVRWHMRDLVTNPQNASEAFRALLKHISGYEPRSSRDLFRRVIESEKSGAN